MPFDDTKMVAVAWLLILLTVESQHKLVSSLGNLDNHVSANSVDEIMDGRTENCTDLKHQTERHCSDIFYTTPDMPFAVTGIANPLGSSDNIPALNVSNGTTPYGQNNSNSPGGHTPDTLSQPDLSKATGAEDKYPRITVTAGGLQKIYSSSKTVIVQSPGFEDNRRFHITSENWVRVDVPPGHVTFVSSVIREQDGCPYTILSLYMGSNSSEHQVWSTCTDLFGAPDETDSPKKKTSSQSSLHEQAASPISLHEGNSSRLKPSVCVTDVFYILSTSAGPVSLETTVNFQFRFTFFKKEEAPVQSSTGQWNCSEPQFGELRQHFLCDLNPDCMAGEDEYNCTYTGRCPHGQFEAGGRCFLFVAPSIDMSWSQANQDCARRGGYLASLNTAQEWSNVTQLLVKTGRRIEHVFVGMREAYGELPAMFDCTRYSMQYYWSDGTVAHYLSVTEGYNGLGCGFLFVGLVILSDSCTVPESPRRKYVCEIPTPDQQKLSLRSPAISLKTPTVNQTTKIQTVLCPLRHLTHAFLACDLVSACWSDDVKSHDFNSFSPPICPAPLASFPPPFVCDNGFERVPYSLVCDHRADCTDASDENFCHFRPCGGDTPVQCGYTKQCIRKRDLCDYQGDCVDGSDEADCFVEHITQYQYTPPPPAISYLGMRPPPGVFASIVQPLAHIVVPYTGPVGEDGLYPCPESHFQCAGNGYCLPVFLRCNGVSDCPGREDEAGCDGYSCPGFYRCRASRVCLHVTNVCDNVPQCPQGDDELLCHVTCSENCTCYGLALTCVSAFPLDLYPDLRYLAAGGSLMSGREVASNRMLVHLGLDHCRLLHLHLPYLPNLRSLDVSYNGLSSISLAQLSVMPELRELRLAGNPLSVLFPDRQPGGGQRPLLYGLDLSQVDLSLVNVTGLLYSRQLRTLNLSNTGLRNLDPPGFQPLAHLRLLDVRGCSLSHLPHGALRGLSDLLAVYADTWKLCCPATLPAGYNLQHCHAPSDVISSCHSLLGSGTVRVVLSICVVLALAGNLALLVVPAVCSKRPTSGTGVLTGHLAACGLATGLSVCVPVTVDRLQYGHFVWRDQTWTHSPVCTLAHFLFLLSTEAAVFTLCLLTVDRLASVLSLPSRWRLRSGGAHVAAGCAWLLGLVLAALPLGWGGYSQTGVCLPLPVVTASLHAHRYCLALQLGIDLALLLLVLIGQTVLCLARPATVKVILNEQQASRDADLVRRLLPVSLAHFACCFLLALLALLASQTSLLPDEVSVNLALVLLPLSAALTPLLYGHSVLAERRRHMLQDRLLKQLLARSRAKCLQR